MNVLKDDYLNPKICRQREQEDYFKKEIEIKNYLSRLNSYNLKVMQLIHLSSFADRDIIRKELQKEKQVLAILLSKMNFDLSDNVIIFDIGKKKFG